MTKLEELLDSYWDAYAVWADADRGASEAADAADYVDAWVAAWDAWIAYRAELIKTQDNSND